MKCVGCYEAKTHLPRLLGQVEKGETITITKHGRPIAKIVPATDAKQSVVVLVEEMLAFRDENGPLLGDDLTIRDLIEEGRR
jgi:prevent-host-death family protein